MELKKKIGYSLGDMGISISYFAVGFFFMYYLTDFVGLPPLYAGIAFFIGKLWDGLNDPLIGILSDRTKSKYGKKRVYILFGAIPFAISFIFLWMIPTEASLLIKFLLSTIALLLYSTFYSIVTVPYMALLPMMTNNYDERTQITSFRAMLSSIGTIIGGSAALLVSKFSNELIGIRTIIIIFAFFTTITLFISVKSTKNVEKKEDIKIVPLKKYFHILKDKNVQILLYLKFFGAIGTGVLVASLPYYTKYVLGNEGISTFGIAIYVFASIIAIPIWNKLTHKIDKRILLIISNSLVFITMIFIAFLGKTSISFFIGCVFLGFFLAGYLFIPYSLVPDLIEYYQYKHKERHESVFFGLWMTVHQLGISVSGFLIGGLLAIGGYVGTQMIQTESALLYIKLSFGIVPGLFLVISAILLTNYTITKKYFLKISRELEK